MIFVIPESQVRQLVMRQLEHFFLPLEDSERDCLNDGMTTAFARCGHCFRHTHYKAYRDAGEPRFNAFHTGQYSIFLYFLSHSLGKMAAVPRSLPERVYALNKALHGMELYFEVEMPAIFMTDHPVGSVIGRGTFGDYFSFTQNCTVGNNRNRYPAFGRNVHLHAGAKVLGDSRVGSNVVFAANACVIDAEIPDCSLVFGSSPNLIIKSRPESYFLRAQGDAQTPQPV